MVKFQVYFLFCPTGNSLIGTTLSGILVKKPGLALQDRSAQAVEEIWTTLVTVSTGFILS